MSSVTGVPGYAGIPLTDARNREIRIVDASEGGVDWERYAAPDTTLVILGAEGAVAEVAKGLVAAGRPDSTPAAMTSPARRPSRRPWSPRCRSSRPTPRAWRRPP